MIRIVLAVSLLLQITIGKSHAQRTDFQKIDFSEADDAAFRYPNHSLRNLKELSDKLTRGLSTDVEKFRAIYRWVCENIEYDYALFQKNATHRAKPFRDEEERQWNKKFNVLVFKTLREKHRAVCTGYAYLVRELTSYANIPCVIVDGYGRTSTSNIGGAGIPNHSWNAVQLNGKWYLCDPTWASGSVESQFHLFIKKYDEAYFLSEPSLFIRNHFPLDARWTLLEDDAPNLNEFLNRPIIYSNAYRYEIHNPHPTKFNVDVSKGDPLSFRFDSNCDLQNTRLLIDGVTTDNTFEKDAQHYTMKHSFKTKGVHVVHLVIDDKSVLTYRVKVN